MVKNKILTAVVLLGLAHGVAAQVTIQSLPTMSVGTGGVATSFSSDLFGKNPKADEIIRYIRELADVELSQGAKEILRQVLLTDVGGVAALEEKQQEYLMARLHTLYRQRLYTDVSALIQTIPEAEKTDEMKQFESRALFALGQVKEACDERLTSAFGREEAYVRVACSFHLKSFEEAALSYDVYREAGGNHTLMNVAGDALFRNIKADLPAEMHPDIFEEEMGLKAYGDEWIKSNDGVARVPTGRVLEKLKAYAKAREELIKELPIQLQQKL